MYVCMYVCMYVHMYVCMDMHASGFLVASGCNFVYTMYACLIKKIQKISKALIN